MKPQKCALPLPLLYLSLLLLRWKLWTRRGTIQTAEILTIVSSKREEWSFLSALLFWDSKNFLLSDPTTAVYWTHSRRHLKVESKWKLTHDLSLWWKTMPPLFQAFTFSSWSHMWLPVNLNLKYYIVSAHSCLTFTSLVIRVWMKNVIEATEVFRTT